MIRIVIIEDEDYAVRRLRSVLLDSADDIEIIAVLGSIEESVNWFRNSEAPDLVFMDVHLSDGNCFEIFDQITPGFPVIFVTAYDQYAINAFQVNGIDYLLKPVKKEEIARGLVKFRRLQKPSGPDLSGISKRILELSRHYQKRLLVKFGNTIKAVDIGDVAYFYSENKGTLLRTFDARTFPVDQTLDEILHIVDPQQFFRINRKFIVNNKAIDSMYSYSRSRIKLVLHPPFEEDTIVSTDRSPGFKSWLTGSPS